MKKSAKVIIFFVGTFLVVLAVVMFIMAIVKGISHDEKQPPSVVVYLNENDSVVNQLMMDVKRLSDLLEKMESDSITVSINKVSKQETSKKGCSSK